MMHPRYAKAGQRIEAERASEPTHPCSHGTRITCEICGASCRDRQAGTEARPDQLAPPRVDPESLTPAQEIAAIAAPYMPHDKWVELYEAIEKALEWRA